MQENAEAPIQVSRAGMAVVDVNGKLIESNQRFSSLVHAPTAAGSLEDCIDYAANPVLGKGMEVLSNSSCLETVSMELKVAGSAQGNTLKAILSRLPNKVDGHQLRFLMMVEEIDQPEPGSVFHQADVQKAIRSRFDHDLRSRLNVILGYCSMMIEDLSDKDGYDEMIEDLKCIATAGNDLISLNGKTSDLLSLIQGGWEARPEEILPANILADTVKNLRSKFPEHTFWLEADDTTVWADANILSKLVSSLIFRLCQELSDGCKIRITAEQKVTSGFYQIVISCTPGARMPADREKLESLIRQVQARTKSDSAVPNLDLFYTDTLCEVLGGRVEADLDQNNSQGSYRIELPACARNA